MADSVPAWWVPLLNNTLDLLSGSIQGIGRKTMYNSTYKIFDHIYNKLKPISKGSQTNDRITIDLKNVGFACIFLALLMCDICHDTSVALVKQKVRSTDDDTPVQFFIKYLETIGYIQSPQLKAQILEFMQKDPKRAIVNQILMKSISSTKVNENQVFCSTNEAMVQAGLSALPVTFATTREFYEGGAENKLSAKVGIFDQSNNGGAMQLMGATGINAIISVVNAGDKGFRFPGNPTVPTQTSLITDILRFLVVKRDGSFFIGPAVWWLATVRTLEADSWKLADQPCAQYPDPEFGKQLAEYMERNEIDIDVLSDLITELFIGRGRSRSLVDLMPYTFWVEMPCEEAQLTFNSIINKSVFRDYNTTWTSQIMVGAEPLISFEYFPQELQENEMEIYIRVSGNNSIMGPPMSENDAEDADIDNTMRKTAGDLNIYLYSLANGMYSITGDRSAAAQYLLFTYLYPDSSKFIYEVGSPQQLRNIVYPAIQGFEPLTIERTTHCPQNPYTLQAVSFGGLKTGASKLLGWLRSGQLPQLAPEPSLGLYGQVADPSVVGEAGGGMETNDEVESSPAATQVTQPLANLAPVPRSQVPTGQRTRIAPTEFNSSDDVVTNSAINARNRAGFVGRGESGEGVGESPAESQETNAAEALLGLRS
jgi:hypothetical protein